MPRPGLAIAAGIAGAAQIAIISAQQIPAFAKGGSMVTNGPQLFMAGDNPGGRERIDITPLNSAIDDVEGNQPIHLQVFLNGVLSYDDITQGTKNGNIKVYQTSLVTR